MSYAYIVLCILLMTVVNFRMRIDKCTSFKYPYIDPSLRADFLSGVGVV